MQQIKFTIFGNPKSWKRHKTVMGKGRYVKHYDPGEIDKSNFLAEAMMYAPNEPIDNPILINLIFNIARPKSHYRTGRFSGELKPNAPIACIVRPDIDNYVKFVFDALDGVFWKDDARICSLFTSKIYSETPSTVVSIIEIVDEEELKHFIID